MTVSCGIVDFHSFFFALTQKKNVKKITDAFRFKTANIELIPAPEQHCADFLPHGSSGDLQSC